MMKKTALLLFSLAITAVLPVTSVIAEPGFMRDVNTACGGITVECSSCHNINDFDEYRDAQGIYESNGPCAFCSDDATCSPARPTNEELLEDARSTTNQYFETLFSKFMQHMQQAKGNFVTVFPDCPEIAPIEASNISRDTGYLVRRVTNRTRNSRNTPDSWEAKQLDNFESMAKEAKPRTPFAIKKPCPEPCTDQQYLNTNEFEATAFVSEEDVEYFRYMRSITMPGLDKLPCLKCHGTFDQLPVGLREAIYDKYPYDMALGYKAGDIRGAWTIKIPLVESEEED